MSEYVEDTIGRFIELRQAGRNFTALCPFHEEQSPSFTVDPMTHQYHYFGCGAHGHCDDFEMEFRRYEAAA